LNSPAAEFPVVFENDNLIVVSKPEGVSSIPERGDDGADALSVLSKRLHRRLYAIYPLDKSATGLLIFAKNADTNTFLAAQFNAGKIEQTYIALLHGATKEKKAKITSALRKFGSGRMGVATGPGGLEAVTEYEVMERFAAHTLVRAFPKSNRRHQIRVHFFGIGHPIVGVPLYGDPSLQKAHPHLLLHAHELNFEIAPGEKQNMTTPMPAYFNDAKKDLPR
jgi:23S rRNA-/tRNA-specific pseudouridylate synthase